MEGRFLLSFDIGTTGAKTCLYRMEETLKLVDAALEGYSLTVLPNGGVEQDPQDWWDALGSATRRLLAKTGVLPEAIRGISFCSQMQGLVLVDQEGRALRPAMSYMDQRGTRQQRRDLFHGVKIAGMNAKKLLASLYLTGGVSASVKDPLWKYKWVEDNEPEIFSRIHKWLDVKEYLILRCTGRAVMTHDSANVTFLYDTRPGHLGWSRRLCRFFGVNPGHLPEVMDPEKVAGPLTAEAAEFLGVPAGTPVFGGGGDLTMLALGAGCVNPGDTHVYIGTSGWVSSVVARRTLDLSHLIASIIAARKATYNYISEQETSGKCLEWVRDHLALDAIGIYQQKVDVSESLESSYNSLMDFLDHVIASTEPGCGGVLFTPWLHGNRSPFEDRNARGIFFNLGLDTGKRMLVRAVVEGLAYHKRWMLSAVAAKAPVSDVIRFVGGGAASDVTSQILADILERPVESLENPQNAGALGAALTAAAGLGWIDSLEQVREVIPVRRRFEPDPTYREIYRRNYGVFIKLYKNNREAFRILNGGVDRE
jgi:xylulokinase